MNVSVSTFLKQQCAGWVLLKHSSDNTDAPCRYGVFHVSDKLTNEVAGFHFWVENGNCYAYPYFGTIAPKPWHPKRQIVICPPLEETPFPYMIGCYIRAKLYPLNKRAELEDAMYANKLYSRDYGKKGGEGLVLMRETELRF